MRPHSRPGSMMDRRPSRESLLSTRRSDAWDSTTSLQTDPKNNSEQTLVGDDIELLVSARPSSSSDYPPINIDFGQPQSQNQENRPYSTAVGWNSSVTLRANSSATSLKDKVFVPRSEEDLGAIYGSAWRDEVDTRAIRIRYALMALHASLFIAKISITVYLRDSLLLIALAFSAICFLLYIPAAFGLSLARKGSRFDHAAGEIGYLAVQLVFSLYATYSPLAMLANTSCSDEWDWFEEGVYAGLGNNKKFCLNQGLSGGISLAQTILLVIWIGWVVVVVIKRGKMEGYEGISRCWEVSIHWLLRDWPINGGRSGPPY